MCGIPDNYKYTNVYKYRLFANVRFTYEFLRKFVRLTILNKGKNNG